MKALIAEQKEKGATVSEDIDRIEYTWENGRLTGIDWGDVNLSGIIDFSMLPFLTSIYCGNNELTGIDISNNKKLMILYCLGNQIEELDLSNNEALISLYCNYNKISRLDVSNNRLLKSINCDEDVEIIGAAEKNADDIAALQKIILQQIELGAEVSQNIHDSQYNWENGHLVGIDWSYAELKGEVDFSEITSLEMLDCSHNSLTCLDVSKNIALKELNCSSNSFTSLDVSKNIALKELNCSSNSFTSLDVSKNTALESLYCYSNSFTSLNVSKNTALKDLNCSYNSLTGLDISKNTALESLYCYSNSFTSLNVSNNIALKDLDCSYNSLTGLDVSKNTALERLDCFSNSLTSLDIRNNIKLISLNIDDGVELIGTPNYNQNDVTALKTIINEQKAVGARCSENIYDPQYSWENGRLVGIQWTGCVINGNLDMSGLTALKKLLISGNGVQDLNVCNNTELTHLYCGDNLLTTLDVSNNTELTNLYCVDNLLTVLDVRNNKKLSSFRHDNTVRIIDGINDDGSDENVATPSPTPIWENEYPGKNVDDLIALSELITYQNTNYHSRLSDNLNDDSYVWKNGRLTELEIGAMRLKGILDVSKLTALTYLDCGSNDLFQSTGHMKIWKEQ